MAETKYAESHSTRKSCYSSSHSSSKSQARDIKCLCGVRAPIHVSNTYKNPRRKFYGCRKYLEGVGCEFFQWVESAEHSEIQCVNDTEDLKSENKILLAENRDLRIENSLLKQNGNGEEVSKLIKEVKKLQLQKKAYKDMVAKKQGD